MIYSPITLVDAYEKIRQMLLSGRGVPCPYKRQVTYPVCHHLSHIQCVPCRLVCQAAAGALPIALTAPVSGHSPQKEFSFTDLRPQNEPYSFFHLTNRDSPLYNPSGRFNTSRPLFGRAPRNTSRGKHGLSDVFWETTPVGQELRNRPQGDSWDCPAETIRS